ncbi:MAG: ATP synthase F1 subunit delta [Blastocatellia bacterium]
MSVTTVARRYAEALVDVAIAHNQVEHLDNDLRAFAETMNASRELHDLFASPIVSQTDKLRVLDALIARLRPDQKTANLLHTMLSHHRLQYVVEVYEQFRREMNEREGLIVAEVTTATEVGPTEREKLGRTLEQITGKRVDFKFKTDTSLVGGVVTRVGSVVYDGSVRTQLREIRERLKQGDTAV